MQDPTHASRMLHMQPHCMDTPWMMFMGMEDDTGSSSWLNASQRGWYVLHGCATKGGHEACMASVPADALVPLHSPLRLNPSQAVLTGSRRDSPWGCGCHCSGTMQARGGTCQQRRLPALP